MAQFQSAHKRTSIFEGGYQCMPDDNGNWTGGRKGIGTLVGTKYGIAAPVLARYLRREPTKLEMQALTHDVAEAIYHKNYWVGICGDRINNQEAANALYDMAVNAGIGTAIKLAHVAAGLEPSITMTEDLLNHLNNKS